MAPILNIVGKDFERAKSLLKLANVGYSIPSLSNSGDFIYVPSMKLYIAKQRTLQGKNWFECHKELLAHEERMLSLPEFIEFLKYTKDNFPEIYKDITEIRDSWRSEWIDADFKTKGRNLYVNSHHVLKNGNLIPRYSESLDRDTLMEDKRIDLESWLNTATNQGLPTKNVKAGDLYYWYPRSGNDSVARFDVDSDRTDLSCNRGPSNRVSSLGVRAVRHE